MLKNRRPYQDLGGDYFDRLRSDGLKHYYVKRLQQLGLSVTIEGAKTLASGRPPS
jgi:hypothetical protein